MSDDLPRPFGPYLLLATLARGGMGEVFFAKHGGLQGFEKHCVVKTLRKELANEEEYVARFTEEARVVVQLAHRNVCTVFDVGRAQGQLYVAMEHVAGRDLRAIAAGPVAPALAVHVVSEVLEALDYAHRFVDSDTDQPLALVHRDVSPHNVLLGLEGDVKLIDFGIMTSSRVGPVTEDGTVLGKLTYMAPEHARGDPVDGRADQYSAAVLLVELLTGVSFNDGLTRDRTWALSGIGGHRPKAFAALDVDLRAILDRALQPNRDNRFATCSELGEAIVGWARRRGHVADARTVRHVMSVEFPTLAADIRRTARKFADARAPSLDIVVRTPGFETIATTMMVAPTTAGLQQAPATLVVHDAPLLDSSGTSPLSTASPLLRSARGRASSAVIFAGALAIAIGGGVVGFALSSVREDGVKVTALPSDPVSALPAPVDTAALALAIPPPIPLASDDGKARAQAALPVPAAKGKPSAKLDGDTRQALAYLSKCLGVVGCAQGLIDWSHRKITDSERDQLADAARKCVLDCKVKR